MPTVRSPPRVQPHCRAPVPDSPRTTQVCVGHDQSSARRGPADRVRGSRRRPVKSRAGGRYPSGKGSTTDRRAPRELSLPTGPTAVLFTHLVGGYRSRITLPRKGHPEHGRNSRLWLAQEFARMSTSPPMRVSRGVGIVRGELNRWCMDRQGEVADLAFESMAARFALVPTPRRLRGRTPPGGPPT